MLTVFHYAKCSTCRKAVRWLRARDIAFRGVDITETPPTAQQLRWVLRDSDLPLKKLFNTSGASYREGGFKERLASMSEDEALGALAADGRLVRRPLVLGSSIALVGFDEAVYEAALGNLTPPRS